MKHFLFLLLATSALASINGAQVNSVFRDGKALVTVTNTSNRDITGYTVEFTAIGNDGKKHYSAHVDDYGPLSAPLHPGSTSQFTQNYPPQITSVEVKISVVIYADQTAEVENEESFQREITKRQEIATALQLSADALDRETRADSAIISIGKINDAAVSGKVHADQQYLKTTMQIMKSAPRTGEAEFIQAHAARLHREADTFKTYAQVRRQQ